ncbi:MAG: galactose-1-phosphate uridylyltransferase, partial [Clostridiales bacterium]|nr:galactose-1-phosphate uridylyltransferase [Clostridiales bacterium]
MLEQEISQLVEYAVQKNWLEEVDRLWAANQLLAALHLDGFDGLVEVDSIPPIQAILDKLCDYAYENGVMEGNSVTYRDLFDTKLMGLLTPKPSEVIDEFL